MSDNHASRETEKRSPSSGELERLRRENRELRQRLDRLEQFHEIVLERNAMLWKYAPRENRFLWVSDNAREIFGFPRERWLEPGFWSEMIHPEDREETLEFCREATEEGRDHEFQYRALHADGSELWVTDIARVTENEETGERLLYGMMLDHTGLKRQEEERRRSQAKLQAVAKNTPDSFLVKDPEGHYLMANQSAADFLQLERDEIIGSRDTELLPEELAGEVREQDREVMEKGETITFETVADLDGEERYFQSSKTPYRDSDGEIIGIIDITRDVTEIKRMEERLRFSHKMESAGRMASGIAHDFNNMLTGILNLADQVKRELPEHHPQRKHLEKIIELSTQAGELSNRLKQVSRQADFELAPIPLNSFLEDSQSLIETLTGPDVDLNVELEEKTGSILGEKGRLEQLLVNLVVNANDAMPEGGRLEIGTQPVRLTRELARFNPDLEPGEYVVLTVSDTGRGMDRAQTERIFEPFYSTKGDGSGLGLAICYRIVKQSGGSIEVASTPGKGTTFRVFLRRSEESPALEEPAVPEALLAEH